MRFIQVLVTCMLAFGVHVAEAQEVKRVQGFSVVLLLGETQGTVPSEGLSPPAQRALADIRQFLPYKGYRVLDTQWVAGSESGESQGRIRGLDQKDYEFYITTFGGPSQKGLPHRPLDRARFQLLTPDAVRIFDNSFTIKADETVVVGTSRIQGENALIVLLTAVVK